MQRKNTHKKTTNSRAIAAQLIARVIDQQSSLDLALASLDPHSTDYSYIKELCFGTIRWFHLLSSIAKQLLLKPLPAKYLDVQCLLLIGLYQLKFLSTPTHAAVSESVNATRDLKKDWAAGLINKTLRRYLREQAELDTKAMTSLEGKTAHPQWLINAIKASWPEQYLSILAQNNQRAPMTLRVNTQLITREQYLELLAELQIAAQASNVAPEALELELAVAVTKLPGFDRGLCYIQDVAGQLAPRLLQPQPNSVILDACAAPGSKSTHLLSYEPKISQLIALDIEESRLQRLADNIKRLQLDRTKITLKSADATKLAEWWDGTLFDQILLDAPCSGTGVIRRHPDIKLLRRPSDIPEQVATQRELLAALWKTLKPGGHLLYSTCSILQEENELQIQAFLEAHSDAEAEPLNLDWGHTLNHGWQCLPGDNNADGFYYARLRKTTLSDLFTCN